MAAPAGALMRMGLRTAAWSAGIQNLLADQAGLPTAPSGRIAWYSLLIALFLLLTLPQVIFGKNATVALRAREPIQ